METLIGMVGASVLGSVGWWLGGHVGFMTAFMLSTVGSGLGLYAGRRMARDFLG